MGAGILRHGLRVSLLLPIVACASEPVDPPTASSLRVTIHDAPANVDQVWVEFTRVTASSEQFGWVTVSDTTQAIDLLSLQNGAFAELGLGALPPGHYDQVRLDIDRAWVINGGVRSDLDIPSGMQSGLKIGHGFDVLACGTTTLALDWNVGAHLDVNANGYSLRPVIDVESTTIAGCGPQKNVDITGRILTGFAVGDDGVYYGLFEVGEGVYRAPFTGGSQLVDSLGNGAIVGLAIDAQNVYDAAGYTNHVATAPRAGGAATVLADGGGWSTSVAVDDTNAYWTDDIGLVRAVPKSGGPVTVLAGAENIPRPIAIDADHVYWVTLYAAELRGVAKTGGTPTTFDTGVSTVQPVADATSVYYVRGSEIRRLSAGTITTIATGVSATALAVHNGRVYFADASGEIRAIAADGSQHPLATGQTSVVALGAVDAYLAWGVSYWTPATQGVVQLYALPL